jgi:hypothetical protein
LRYTHDQVTGEFVNVGIVVFAPEHQFLEAKVVSRFSRISNFFEDINGYHLLHSLKHFQKELASVRNELAFFGAEAIAKPAPSLTQITSRILVKDDSALQLSDVRTGMDLDLSHATEDLFYRMVDKYNIEPGGEVKNDSYVWTKIYKSHFDKYGVTSHLQDHTIQTKTDKITFDKSWKNGSWHCYQTLAFDLKKEDSIKNKVYKWSGIIKALQAENESLNLYFLTTNPAHNPQLQPFIVETLGQEADKLKVTIVTQEEAEAFALNVKKQIESAIDDPFH